MISSARLWSFAPTALLAAMLTGLATMAGFAVRDPGFALERDYYDKAVHYDRELAQRAENARLGWTLEASVGPASPGTKTSISLGAREHGMPIDASDVRVTAIRNADASLNLEGRLLRNASGEYAVLLPLEYGGLWEFRFSVQRGGERYTESIRRDVEQR
jgi:hypothetical protein